MELAPESVAQLVLKVSLAQEWAVPGQEARSLEDNMVLDLVANPVLGDNTGQEQWAARDPEDNIAPVLLEDPVLAGNMDMVLGVESDLERNMALEVEAGPHLGLQED